MLWYLCCSLIHGFSHIFILTAWKIAKTTAHQRLIFEVKKLEAVISKNYCAKNAGSPEVELSFCPWLKLFKY
jgi:hypothetical protein